MIVEIENDICLADTPSDQIKHARTRPMEIKLHQFDMSDSNENQEKTVQFIVCWCDIMYINKKHKIWNDGEMILYPSIKRIQLLDAEGRKLENCLFTDLLSVKTGETIYLEHHIIQIGDVKDVAIMKEKQFEKKLACSKMTSGAGDDQQNKPGAWKSFKAPTRVKNVTPMDSTKPISLLKPTKRARARESVSSLFDDSNNEDDADATHITIIPSCDMEKSDPDQKFSADKTTSFPEQHPSDGRTLDDILDLLNEEENVDRNCLPLERESNNSKPDIKQDSHHLNETVEFEDFEEEDSTKENDPEKQEATKTDLNQKNCIKPRWALYQEAESESDDNDNI